jgi:drug/metabolite transporter (DMT)-like permease
MSALTIIALFCGTLAAAGGQLLFALGARGRTEFTSFLNVWILMGLALYGLGTTFWIYGLSRAPLIQVYPFTALTFVVIYASSITMLGERPTLSGGCGVVLVLAGLYLVLSK